MSSIDLRPRPARAAWSGELRLGDGIVAVICCLVLAGLHYLNSVELNAARQAEQVARRNHQRLVSLVEGQSIFEDALVEARRAAERQRSHRRAAADAACTLRRVAAALPDDLWLDQFDWQPGRIRLIGHAADAAAVHGLATGLGWTVQRVELSTSAVNPASTPDVRLEFGLELADPTALEATLGA